MTRSRLLIIAFGLIIAVVVFAGVYVWQNVVFLGDEQPIADTPHQFVIQDGVTDRDIQLIADTIRLADDYFASQFGTPVTQPMTFRLAKTTPCIPFEPLESGRTAFVEGDLMCVNTVNTVWSEYVADDPILGQYIIAHEYFHALQEQLSCLPDPEAHQFVWWVEGSATYVGWQVLLDEGIITEADVNDRLRAWGGFDESLDSLQTYENNISGDAQYALGYRAIDMLTERTEDIATHGDFCRGIDMSQLDEWESVFESAYGMSPQAFYEAFEAMR